MKKTDDRRNKSFQKNQKMKILGKQKNIKIKQK